MRRKRKIITSGDPLVDCLFEEVIRFLNYRTLGIYKKKKLRNPNDRRVFLSGFLSPIDDKYYEIYLLEDLKSRDEMAKTILHEALHMIMQDTRESKIIQLESELYCRLSRQQQFILKSYIPKYCALREPEGD